MRRKREGAGLRCDGNEKSWTMGWAGAARCAALEVVGDRRQTRGVGLADVVLEPQGLVA